MDAVSGRSLGAMVTGYGSLVVKVRLRLTCESGMLRCALELVFVLDFPHVST